MVVATSVARVDVVCLARISAGDGDALAALYDRYGRLASTLARRVLGDGMAAEDVVQEVFLAAWRSARGFDARRGSVRAWLLASVHHRCIDRLRGRACHGGGELPLALLADQDDGGDVFEQVAGRLEAARVRRALGALPAEQRQALALAYFDGLSHAAIAVALAQPLGTVKGRTRLGLAKLREALAAPIET